MSYREFYAVFVIDSYFIHRPEYYTKSGEDAQGNDIRGLAELIVAKHRSGDVGDVKLRFVSKYAKFENWQEGYFSFASDPLPAEEYPAST